MNIILYSTGCPKCNVLKKKLAEKNIPYEEITDVEEMDDMGLTTVPVLAVDGYFKDFPKACEWINNYTGD